MSDHSAEPAPSPRVDPASASPVSVRRFDPRLAGCDYVLHQWAAAALAKRDPARKSRVPALADAEAARVTGILQASPPYVRALVAQRYLDRHSVQQIADARGISKSAAYDEQRLALWYLLGRFTEAGVSLPTIG
jgi:DNA-directed RNA polymerase specialized sigma24 family protein